MLSMKGTSWLLFTKHTCPFWIFVQCNHLHEQNTSGSVGAQKEQSTHIDDCNSQSEPLVSAIRAHAHQTLILTRADSNKLIIFRYKSYG